MSENSSVTLTPAGAALFPDLAGRTGTFVRTEGEWAAVLFGSVQVWIRRELVECMRSEGK